MTTRTIAPSLSGLLTRSLRVVAQDTPLAYELLVEALDQTVVAIRSGNEQFFLIGGAVHSHTAAPVDVRFAIAVPDLLRLIQGRTGLTEELAAARLELVGSIDHLARLNRALELLLHGILRSRQAASLLHQLHALAVAASPSQQDLNSPSKLGASSA